MFYLGSDSKDSYIEYGSNNDSTNCDWISISEDFDSANDYWSFDILENTFTVLGTQVGFIESNFAILDTGTSIIYIPSNDFDTLLMSVANGIQIFYDEIDELYWVECRSVFDLPDIEI